MSKELTVLKLGGSLLTDKSKPYEARTTLIDSVAKELSECLDEGLIESLVLVQGVGSYGHPPVLEHALHKGFRSEKQLLAISKTQRIVNQLRDIVVESLQKHGVPVNLMHPSSMVVAEKMQIKDYFLAPLRGYLKIGTVPLVGGDMLYDTAMGFSVGSGDPLAVLLTKELGAKRLLFVTDVAGIYEQDPKVNPDASLLSEVNLNELESILEQMGKSGVADASGAMKGKLGALKLTKDLIEKGLEVALLSMMQPDNLRGFLRGDEVEATRVVVR
ncbi:amino acid kinase [Candidatus Thorarchaeota archaeon]|jgi:isopentenyl phosphate kinase|nr:MAG: amino acid kinase [Candidatus Thorarchaeota archaeon]